MGERTSKKQLVVLSGAGMSAESGIATFRGADGLWEGHRVEEVASPEGFAANPELVMDFYNQRRRQVVAATPNEGHRALARLEDIFDVKIVTQNVDDLHERAGSTQVMHLHGEIRKARSTSNPELVLDVPGTELNMGDLGPDGAQLRPHIVWFGEAVPMIDPAMEWVMSADVVVVVGTSLQVYPAAGLVGYAPPDAPIHVVDPNTPLEGGGRVELHRCGAVEGLTRLEKKVGRRSLMLAQSRPHAWGISARPHPPGADALGGHGLLSARLQTIHGPENEFSRRGVVARKRTLQLLGRKMFAHESRVEVS